MRPVHVIPRLAAGLAGILIIAACGAGGGEVAQATGPVTLQVMNFANYMPEDIGERFKAATGHDIEVTLTSSNEDAIAKLDASPAGTYDIVFITNPFAEGLNKAGKLEALDHAKIPNLAEPVPGGDPDRDGPGQQVLRPVLVGDDRHLLPVGPRDGDRDRQLERPAGAERRARRQDHDDGRGPLADDPGAQGPRLLGELDGQGGARCGRRPADQGQVHPPRLRRRDLLHEARQRHGRRRPWLGRLVQLRAGSLDDGLGAAQGGLGPVRRHDGDPEGLAAAGRRPTQFIDFILLPENGQWVAENILYKVPNKAAMDALDPALLETYPNMAITPAELLKQESLRDLGDGSARPSPTPRPRSRPGRRRVPGAARCRPIPASIATPPRPGRVAGAMDDSSSRRRSRGGRVLLVLPIALVLASSFFRRGSFGGVVYDFTLDNYLRAIDPLFLGILWYSILIASITTAHLPGHRLPGRVLHRDPPEPAGSGRRCSSSSCSRS